MNYRINKAAVIGSGTMGAGIAAHLAGAGIQVRLLDIIPKELDDSEIKQGLTLVDKKVRNRIAQKGKDFATNQKTRLKLIYEESMGDLIEVGNLEDDVESLSDCDWIVEVIVERLDIKKDLMNKIARYRKPGSIVSTNTSGIPVNSIVEDQDIEFKKNFLSTHFFNPVRYMKLLELIPCTDSSDELMSFMTEFGEKRLGKGIVVARDTPSFVANRIGGISSKVYAKMAEYDLNVAEADELSGGLLKMMDLVGLDLAIHASKNMLSVIDDEEERKIYELPEFLKKMIADNRLGNKTQGGFFKRIKTEKGKETLMFDIKTEEYVPITKRSFKCMEDAAKETSYAGKLEKMNFGSDIGSKFVWDMLKSKLLFAAERAPEIANKFTDIDDGMEWGYNHKLGPFKEWDALGFEKVLNRMKDEGETIPAMITEMVNSGRKSFYDPSVVIPKPYIDLKTGDFKVIIENDDACLWDLGDGVACIDFRTKGNSLTSGVSELLKASLEEVEKNYKGLVIGNNGKNFCVGANLNQMESSDPGDRDASFKAGQNGMLDAKYAPFPTVAAVSGRALGAGAELSLHSYSTVAHAESIIGLVETGVGLIPAAGGTKELALNAYRDSQSKGAAELAGNLLEPFQRIMMAQTSSSAFEAAKMGYLNGKDRIVMNKDYLLNEAKARVLSLVEEGFQPRIRNKMVKVPGRAGIAFLQAAIYNMKSNRYMSDYDAFIAEKVAYVLSGGDVVEGTYITEEHLLDLERKVFIDLLGQEKTQARIEYMLKNKKPLRN